MSTHTREDEAQTHVRGLHLCHAPRGGTSEGEGPRYQPGGLCGWAQGRMLHLTRRQDGRRGYRDGLRAGPAAWDPRPASRWRHPDGVRKRS